MVLGCGLTAYASGSSSVENLVFRMRLLFPHTIQVFEDISKNVLVFHESIM
jgi:hypothetical protein